MPSLTVASSPAVQLASTLAKNQKENIAKTFKKFFAIIKNFCQFVKHSHNFLGIFWKSKCCVVKNRDYLLYDILMF